MRRTRLILTSLLLGALVCLALPSTAGAGILISIDVDATCDTATGDYDVTYTLNDLEDLGGLITVLEFEVDGADAPFPVFNPAVLPALGTSSATVQVPGDTTTLYLDFSIDFPEGTQFGDSEDTLDGDCVAVPTTTTTSTTSTTEAPTTTVAPAAVAVARTPAFTG